jgi:hypothetical protein
MVTELQFAAIIAFLMWGLVSSLCGVLNPDGTEAPARLIWREHGPAGWSGWRQLHFGLTAADRRIVTQPEPVLDDAACTGLFDTVLQQTRQPDSDAVQFAIVRAADDQGENETIVVFVSDVLGTAADLPDAAPTAQTARRSAPQQVANASASPSVDPSLAAQAT